MDPESRSPTPVEQRGAANTADAQQSTSSTEEAWRLLTNNLGSVERQNLSTSGDPKFVKTVLSTRAIIGMPK